MKTDKRFEAYYLPTYLENPANLVQLLPTWVFYLPISANLKSQSSISAGLRGIQVGKLSARIFLSWQKLAQGSLRLLAFFEVVTPDTLSPTGRERIPMGISLIPTGRRVGASQFGEVHHG